MEPISFTEWLFDHGLNREMYDALPKDEQDDLTCEYYDFVLSLSGIF